MIAKGHRILFIDFCDFEDYPIGGYLSFAKNMVESFGSDLALAGITTRKEDPVGRWFKKKINDTVYDFFAIARFSASKTRHLIPDRFVSYLLIRLYKKRIFTLNIKNIFIQRQEILLAVSKMSGKNICYCFAGLENPLAISKYGYAKYFSRRFERVFFSRLKFVNTILASGDDNAIREMITRSNSIISEGQVVKFPSRINTRIFAPLGKHDARIKLNLPVNSTIIVTTGRLAPLKGWKFMIDCFKLFEKIISGAVFYFVGDGEAKGEILNYIYNNNLNEKIILTGSKSQNEVALFLNASDLFIMGSYKEGWSTSLIEAIACGIPSVVTEFSSADEIVEDGINGFIVSERNIDVFVQCMVKALKIPRPVKNDKVKALSANCLKEQLLNHWQLS